MRVLTLITALFVAAPAVAQATGGSKPAAPQQAEKTPREVPEKWRGEMEKQLLRGQKLVQTLVGDLDGDGRDEWIAVGEPAGEPKHTVSVAIFSPAEGKQGPKLRFAQRVKENGLAVAGAEIRNVAPAGNVIVLAAAAPRADGDSLFRVQMWGWDGKRFRPIVPEGIEFRSQGGFAIEDLDPSRKGDEIAVWTYQLGENEQLFDAHRYVTRIYRWDGLRFVAPDWPDRTAEKLATPDDAARLLGVKTGDLRRRMPRVAEVP